MKWNKILLPVGAIGAAAAIVTPLSVSCTKMEADSYYNLVTYKWDDLKIADPLVENTWTMDKSTYSDKSKVFNALDKQIYEQIQKLPKLFVQEMLYEFWTEEREIRLIQDGDTCNWKLTDLEIVGDGSETKPYRLNYNIDLVTKIDHASLWVNPETLEASYLHRLKQDRHWKVSFKNIRWCLWSDDDEAPYTNLYWTIPDGWDKDSEWSITSEAQGSSTTWYKEGEEPKILGEGTKTFDYKHLFDETKDEDLIHYVVFRAFYFEPWCYLYKNITVNTK